MQALIVLPRAPVNLAPMAANAFRGTPGSVTAQVRFTSSGHAQIDNGSGLVTQYEWLFSGGTPGNYEINYAGMGFATGLMNTWQVLSSDRTWSITQSVLGTNVDSGTISIRQTGSSIALATYAMSLTASVGSP